MHKGTESLGALLATIRDPPIKVQDCLIGQKCYNRSVSRCKYSILCCNFFVLDAQKLNILRDTVCFLNSVTTDILGQAGKNEVYL